MTMFVIWVTGFFIWLMLFIKGWPLNTIIPLIVAGGLFIYFIGESVLLKRKKTLTFITLLTYCNIAFGGWVIRYWQAHGYPLEIWFMRFFMLVAAVMSVAFVKGNSQSAPRNKQSFKSFFKRKRKDDRRNEVSIVLGETADEDDNHFGG